ncbi:MAG TPA: hypothetical protein VF345_03140, partial [Chthoniobacterales bacterium]
MSTALAKRWVSDKEIPTVTALPSIIDAVELLESDLPTPPEVVRGILHKGSKMVIGGGSKSFKTWTLLDLAV